MLAENLRRLRRERGLSQVALAEKAGLSLPAYRNLETGKSQPREETLQSLAVALGVRARDLLAEVQPLRSVRFRANKKMKRRAQVLTDVAGWLKNYNALEQMLNNRKEFSLSPVAAEFSHHKPGPERARNAAGKVRHSLGLSEKETIRDICGLLESGGVKVYPLSLASDDFFGLSVAENDGGPATVVNVWDRISVERWIFTAAHELGHLLLHLDSFDIDNDQEDPDEEIEANVFASHFLMPEKLFQKEWDETHGLPLVDRVLKVKRIFRVSYRSVLYRLIEAHGLPRSLWYDFQIAFAQRFGRTLRKSDEPQGLLPDAFQAAMPEASRAHEPSQLDEWDFVEDRFRGLVRQAVEARQITLSRGSEMLKLSLPEMRKLASTWRQA